MQNANSLNFIRTERPRPRAVAWLKICQVQTLHFKRRYTMLLTASEICANQPIDSWFCLRARPKREHIAAACLRKISEVEVFCPRVRLRKSTNRGPVWFIESMFPGYLFARFDYGIFHRQIIQRPGVSGFVHFGERLALLPDALIGEIRIRIGTDEKWRSVADSSQGRKSR